MKHKKYELLNQRGQGSDVFRLLIGAVMALAILLIVLGIVNLVGEEKFKLSRQRFFDGFSTAHDSPDGLSPVEREKLFFNKHEIFTSDSLARQFQMQPQCIQFFSEHPRASSFPGYSGIEMLDQLNLTVVFSCESNGPNQDCPIQCTVTFR